MSNKQGQDSLPSYTDGVKVKISEQYKPPPRINLPVSYAQRLLINKQIHENVGHYDFSLEKTVKERLTEWKMARAVVSDEHKQRLEKIKEMREKNKSKNLEDDDDNNQDNANQLKDSNFTNYLPNTDVLMPTMANRADVLMPMPLSILNSEPYICKPTDKSPFNISDFEADTSSPFDNVELKTLNDMAELALVLQPNDDKNLNSRQYSSYVSTGIGSIPYTNYNRQNMIVGSNHYSYPSQLPTTSTSAYVQPMNSNPNGYYYTASTYRPSAYITPAVYDSKDNSNVSASAQISTDDDNKLPSRSVRDIMKALETELNHTHVSNTKNNQLNHSIDASNHVPNASQKKNADEIENSYKTLPRNLQQLSKLISGMGFPLSRVARTCKLLGDDQKKVVEHLLAMSELLDLGFPESQVSNALLKCDNDRDKALDMLIL